MLLIKLMIKNIFWIMEKNSGKLFMRVFLFFSTLLLWWISGFIFKLVLAFILLFLFPGFFVLRFLKTKDWVEALLFSILFGFTFQILLAYTLSLFDFHFLSPFLFLSSFILWIVSPNLPPFIKSDKKKLYLLSLIVLFHLVLYLYPSSQVVRDAWRDVGFLPVGDDSKHHLLIVKSILKEGKVPTSYYLYPEIPLTYPVGYHVIISILHYFSSFDLLKLMFFFPLFSLFLLVLASFILASRIFDKQTGYISSLLIPSIPQTIIMVTYGNSPQLLSLSFLFASLSLLFNKESKSYLIPIFFSSTFYLSPYSLFIGAITISLFMLVSKRFNGFIIFIIISILSFLPLYSLIHSSFSNNISNPFRNTSKDYLVNLWQYSLPERINIDDFILFLRPFNEVIIALGILCLLSLRKRILLSFFIPFIFSSFIFLLIRRMPIFLNGLTLGFENILFSLSDTRILFLIFYPLAFLSSFFLSKLKIRKLFIIIFLFLLLFPIHLERGKLNLDYRALTLGDWEYIKFVNETIPKDAILYNDYYRGAVSNSLPSYVERRISYPFLMYYPILDFDGEREIIRNIPDSTIALDILRKENASYLTFSTGFNLESTFGFSVPSFNPNNFKVCYERIYGNYSNWIFRINYNCSPFIYLPVFHECKKWCELPSQINITLPEFLRNFRLLLIAKVLPTNIGYSIGFTKVLQNEKEIATWSMIKIEKEFLFVAELNPKESLNIKFEGEKPLVKNLMIVAEVNGSEISLAKDVWAALLNNKDIIVFNPNFSKIKLTIEYNNTRGNLYFNVFNYSILTWITIGSIERNGSYTIVKKEIELLRDKYLFLSIASHDYPLEIRNIKIVPSEPIFIDADTSWIGTRIVNAEDLNLSSFFSVSQNIYLRGNWVYDEKKIILPPKTLDCQVILYNISKNFYLKITYEDADNSEININYWNNLVGKWETAFVFNTNGMKKTKELVIPFFTYKKGAILNLYSHQKELRIINMNVEVFE